MSEDRTQIATIVGRVTYTVETLSEDELLLWTSGRAVPVATRFSGTNASAAGAAPEPTIVLNRQARQLSASKSHSSQEGLTYKVWSAEETQNDRMVVTSSTSDDVSASGNASFSSVFSLTTNCQLAALSS